MATCFPSKSKGDLFLRGLSTIDSEESAPADFPYREIIGSLQHLATHSRPDIAIEVATLAKFNDSPGRLHVDACRQLLRYLKHTHNWGLVLGGSEDMTLFGYSDASEYGDHSTARGTGGYIFLFGRGAVSHKAKWFRNIYPSSTEAEIVALFMATSEAVYLRNIITFFGFRMDTPTVIHIDNEGAHKYTHSLDRAGRMRHINIKFRFTREKLHQGIISTEVIPSDSNAADLMTKTLRGSKLRHHSQVLGLSPLEYVKTTHAHD